MRLAADIERLTVGIRALRIVRQCMRHEVDVGKLSAVADRIRKNKALLDMEDDKLEVKLDAIDKLAPVAFKAGHAFLDSQKAEVAEIEGTLRELSRLTNSGPLDGSPDDLPPADTIQLPATETAQSGTADDHNAVARGIAGAITAQAAPPTGLATHRSFPAATVSRAFGE